MCEPNQEPQAPAALTDARALVYLAGCAVQQLVPRQALLQGMDWPQVYRLSMRHALAAAACMAVESGLAAAPLALTPEQQQVLARWKDAKNKAIRKNMLLDAERGQLAEFCEQLGCWYLPLKGVVLQELYPRPGMRQMADNDILFDARYQKQIEAWFVARGYQAESVGRSNHDVYQKPPIYNFELHTALFDRTVHPPLWADYYDRVEQRLLPDRGRFGRRFSPEDFYVYITLHTYKHHQNGGTGLRSLLDCCVYCQACYAGLDHGAVQAQLQALGIAEFEQEARALSLALFADPEQALTAPLAPQQLQLLHYCLGAGTYGTVENRVRNKLAQAAPQGQPISGRAKARYLLSRVFPPQSLMVRSYPRLARWRALLPLCYLHRLVVKGITRSQVVRVELDTVRRAQTSAPCTAPQDSPEP